MTWFISQLVVEGPLFETYFSTGTIMTLNAWNLTRLDCRLKKVKEWNDCNDPNMICVNLGPRSLVHEFLNGQNGFDSTIVLLREHMVPHNVEAWFRTNMPQLKGCPCLKSSEQLKKSVKNPYLYLLLLLLNCHFLTVIFHEKTEHNIHRHVKAKQIVLTTPP